MNLHGINLRYKCRNLHSKCKLNHKANTNIKRDTESLEWAPLDIEEIIKAGETKHFCPYY
jgi:hypothetical protein